MAYLNGGSVAGSLADSAPVTLQGQAFLMNPVRQGTRSPS
jgi:hypothetical protein